MKEKSAMMAAIERAKKDRRKRAAASAQKSSDLRAAQKHHIANRAQEAIKIQKEQTDASQSIGNYLEYQSKFRNNMPADSHKPADHMRWMKEDMERLGMIRKAPRDRLYPDLVDDKVRKYQSEYYSRWAKDK